MNEGEISPQLFHFHLRASRQDTRKYTFKTHDEVLLAPQGYYQPTIFDNSRKLKGRRKLIDRSYDLQQHVSQQRSVPISDPDDLQEFYRLPVEVISFTNPKVERSAWAATQQTWKKVQLLRWDDAINR